MVWDPAVYQQYGDERLRPFLDLLHRVPTAGVATVIDAGCGPGTTTALLAGSFPSVSAVDSSPAMVAAAREQLPGADIFHGDLATWMPPRQVDLVVCNAVLHWLPHHRAVLQHLSSWLTAAGALAFQIPANFWAPSHRAVAAVAAAGPWSRRLADVPDNGEHVLELEAYAQLLTGMGFAVQAWETTYLHALSGPDPVLDWLKGTTLRPHLARLDDPEPFMNELGNRLREAYPPDAAGVVWFPFTRRFVVATQ